MAEPEPVAPGGTAGGPAAAGPPWPVRARAGAVAPVLVLAVASLWWPDNWDNALFVAGARQLDRGGEYYRDVWDIKQPGIYWFHQLGGLLEPSGLGARVMEAALAVLAAWLVTVVVAGWPLRGWVRAVSPSLVVGPALWWSFRGGIGQVESLMVVSLLIVLAATTRGTGGRRSSVPSWFLAGTATGWVGVMKLLYLPLPLLLVVLALAAMGRRGRARPTGSAVAAVVGRAVAVLAGMMLPLGLFAGYLARQHLFGIAWWTSVTLPPQVLTVVTPWHSAGERAELVRSTVALFVVTGPLALLALGTARRRRGVPERTLALAAVLALVLTVPQLWTPYRYLTPTVPVGLLAVAGLQQLRDWWVARARRSRVGDVLALVLGSVLVLLPAQPAVSLVLTADRHPWGLDPRSRVARGTVATYGDPQAALDAAAVVAGQVRPDEPVYVLGDPSVLHVLQARPGAEVMGWSLEVLPPLVVDEAARELARSRPRWVFVHDIYQPDGVQARVGAPFQPVLARYYRVYATGAHGTWYVTDQVGVPPPDADGVRLP